MSASSEQATPEQTVELVTAEKRVVLSADLHARPAGQVTRVAAGLDAGVWLSVGDRPEVDARSVLAVMGLGAVAGDTVRVRAAGARAQQAADSVAAVLAAAEAVPPA